eukprot:6823589-Pyramimonas_sp.AAC.1
MGVRRGWSLSAASIRDTLADGVRRGTFSTPHGGAQRWSLSAASIRDTLAGRGKRGTFSTPHGGAQR